MSRHLIILLFLSFSLPSAAAKRKPLRTLQNVESSTTSERLSNAINNILQKKKDLSVGIIVKSIDNNAILYEKNSDQLLIPASVNKVLTAYAALKKLKPTGTFKTQIYRSGPIHEGKLQGDLYLKGGGDPGLVSERMWMLVNDLRRSGVKIIQGNIYVDSTFYDEEKTPDSRPKYLTDQAYNAPVGALSFNFNTTTVYVRPGEEVGKPPIVITDPANSYVEIVNQAKTGKEGTQNSIVVSRTDYVKGDIGDTVLLRGSIPLGHRELRFYKNIVNPALYAGHMFKTFLAELGIQATGNIVEGTVPSSAKQLLEFESQPLWHIIWGMNKFSNNFVADQIMKKIGAEVWGTPGTMQKGVTALQDVLEDIGIRRKDYEVKDGSGLTRGTKITCRQILTVLEAAYRDFGISPEFIASLGIAGEDGTLRNRFPSSNSFSTLRAKTGTLDGVSSLAGFLPSNENEMLGFVILLNDPKGKYGKMTTWVDQIALAIAKFSRK